MNAIVATLVSAAVAQVPDGALYDALTEDRDIDPISMDFIVEGVGSAGVSTGSAMQPLPYSPIDVTSGYDSSLADFPVGPTTAELNWSGSSSYENEYTADAITGALAFDTSVVAAVNDAEAMSFYYDVGAGYNAVFELSQDTAFTLDVSMMQQGSGAVGFALLNLADLMPGGPGAFSFTQTLAGGFPGTVNETFEGVLPAGIYSLGASYSFEHDVLLLPGETSNLSGSGSVSFNLTFSAVPAPGAMSLLGLASVFGTRRRRR